MAIFLSSRIAGVRTQKTRTWIPRCRYPEAAYEDLSAFIQKILARSPSTAPGIRAGLHTRYRLSVSHARLAGILQAMEETGAVHREGDIYTA